MHSPIAATSVESLIAYLREAKVLRSKISTLKGASGSGRHTEYSYNAFTSQGGKLKHFGELLADIVMPDLADVETESSLELNFLVGKIKHTVRRIKRKLNPPND